jgi:hypothetical protein
MEGRKAYMKKIVGILVMMLLIASALHATGMDIKTNVEHQNNANITPITKDLKNDVPPAWLEGADQKQTEHNNYGFTIMPPILHAQEFKPTVDKLTAVALYMFKYQNPPSGLQITVSIREELNGSDLTSRTINANMIKADSSWYMFDFEDITVTPEDTYYIMCYGGGGDAQNAYCWLFAGDNKYDRGIAWVSEDDGETWEDLEDPGGGWKEIDQCFITYFETPKSKQVNKPFINVLENYFNLFPIFKLLLQRFALI